MIIKLKRVIFSLVFTVRTYYKLCLTGLKVIYKEGLHSFFRKYKLWLDFKEEQNSSRKNQRRCLKNKEK